MGNMAYDILACEANFDQYPSYVLGYPSLPEDTYGAVDLPVFPSPSTDYTGSPTITYVSASIIWLALENFLTYYPRCNPSLCSPPPSPSPSQCSSTSEGYQASFESSPAPRLNCSEATPIFNHIRKKWSCSICNRCFRGKWECKRHIGVVGKRVKCLMCEGVLSGREDSLRRHFTKYCKGNLRNLEFEDAFIEL